jgi:hypothetical protein
MSLWQWSTTAANNATAATNINWQEGQAPSTVNDSARQMMADVATWFQGGAEWLNMGDTPTYVNGTQFTVPGNLTSRYSFGRRVRASVTAGTVYGTITASAFGSVTTVTLQLDSGALDSGLSEVDVGILNPSAASLSTLPSLLISGAAGLTFANLASSNTAPIKFGDGTGWKLNFETGSGSIFSTLQDNGNFTTNGTVTASNVTITSDERIKGEWEDLPPDFIDRLAAVKMGTYRRTDTESPDRHVGVGAQSLRDVLPEAVLEGASGMLSVAYGNAALAACVELAKEVKRLRALVESK